MKILQKKFVTILIIAILFIFAQNKVLAAENTYTSIDIGMNQGMNVNNDVAVSLVLGEHEKETLKAVVYTTGNQLVQNPAITWSSSDQSIVSVDASGVITAKKVGTATITATGGGISKSRKVNVTQAPKFVDFSKATYTWYRPSNMHGTDLKISNVSYQGLENSTFYYVFTDSNTKPQLNIDEHGAMLSLDNKNLKLLLGDAIQLMDEYVELNKDIYLWIIQHNQFDSYYKEDGTYISSDTKFVVEGKKLDKFPLPTYSGCFNATFIASDKSQIIMEVPCNNTRQFTIKIGKVTDTNILNKIKNKESDAFAKLETYAKSNSPVYEQKVTSESSEQIKYTKVLPLDGKLQDDEYYYMYIIYDDENQKYAPIEHCLTLAQASVNDGNWSLFFYGKNNFKWKDFVTEESGQDQKPSSTAKPSSPTQTSKDPTVSQLKLPQTGKNAIIIVAVGMLIVAICIIYHKNKKYSDIK